MFFTALDSTLIMHKLTMLHKTVEKLSIFYVAEELNNCLLLIFQLLAMSTVILN